MLNFKNKKGELVMKEDANGELHILDESLKKDIKKTVSEEEDTDEQREEDGKVNPETQE